MVFGADSIIHKSFHRVVTHVVQYVTEYEDCQMTCQYFFTKLLSFFDQCSQYFTSWMTVALPWNLVQLTSLFWILIAFCAKLLMECSKLISQCQSRIVFPNIYRFQNLLDQPQAILHLHSHQAPYLLTKSNVSMVILPAIQQEVPLKWMIICFQMQIL